MEEIRIRDEFIKLGQLLKLADLVQDGVKGMTAAAGRSMKVMWFLMMEKKLK